MQIHLLMQTAGVGEYRLASLYTFRQNRSEVPFQIRVIKTERIPAIVPNNQPELTSFRSVPTSVDFIVNTKCMSIIESLFLCSNIEKYLSKQKVLVQNLTTACFLGCSTRSSPKQIKTHIQTHQNWKIFVNKNLNVAWRNIYSDRGRNFAPERNFYSISERNPGFVPAQEKERKSGHFWKIGTKSGVFHSGSFAPVRSVKACMFDKQWWNVLKVAMVFNILMLMNFIQTLGKMWYQKFEFWVLKFTAHIIIPLR